MESSRRWHTDKRHFKRTWEEEYFFTDINSKAVCLICGQSVAVLKEYNIRRHYETRHAAFSRFKGEARKTKSRELLAKLRSQQNTLTRPSSAQESATQASYEISALIARSGRSFSTGDFVKECLSTAAKLVCPAQARAFSQISLSANYYGDVWPHKGLSEKTAATVSTSVSRWVNALHKIHNFNGNVIMWCGGTELSVVWYVEYDITSEWKLQYLLHW